MIWVYLQRKFGEFPWEEIEVRKESAESDPGLIEKDEVIETNREKSTEPQEWMIGYTPEVRKQIDQACMGWVGRGYIPKRNMDEYLEEFYKDTNIYMSRDQFKKALRDAGERGLIVKINRRWRLPEGFPKNNS